MEIIKLTSIEAVNEDLEKFTGKVFTVLDDDSYREDFPDRTESFHCSRTLNKKLFNLLMDKGMKMGEKISFEFIKSELKKEVGK